VTKETCEKKVHDAWPTFSPLSAAVRTELQEIRRKIRAGCTSRANKGRQIVRGRTSERLGRAAAACIFWGLLVKEKLLPLGKVFRSLCVCVCVWVLNADERAGPAFIFIVRFSACEIPAHTQHAAAAANCSNYVLELRHELENREGSS